ncbi:2-oxoglutarate dehydrogenase E1 component [Evansella caseinilytica]|uniref:2-oxoglutarate dehydrogenase E1 component n=1 Tax=Evansella caseinilytica TaxID=1503961 RepID=A0A1H3NNG8_9BACI|nr:2-oxoglutarate dehydrogenase E1 component [Evansella caseinilytica]SDY90497.1 2-oxoglutarate dehydrogenase E1 component [Evansella caseinilytica]
MSNNEIRFDQGWQQFYGPNLGYMLEVYDDYQEHPGDVEAELRLFFEKWGPPPNGNGASGRTVEGRQDHQLAATQMATVANAIKLADSIRKNGHLMANISPVEEKDSIELFQLGDYELTEADLRKIPAALISADAPEHVTDGYEAIQHLRHVYTDTMAFEFHQVHDIAERRWLIHMVESGEYRPKYSTEKKIRILNRLNKVEGFEHFLHKTFVGQKRFSIEGLDSMVPMLDDIVRQSVEDGVRKMMIGMAHRGRLNVLAHVLGKPYEMIFSEFHDAPNKELVPSEGSIGINYGWTGDVKYHLGADREITEQTVKATITLANNPSHLEFVNPVVEGFARAAQENRKKPGHPDQDKNAAMPILIHGDAAFPGQGIVAETLNLSQLRGYSTGGTVHIIANNMIGFTTTSSDSRSTKYASDLAKGFEIPVIHVNADDPEACVAVMRLAYRYRRQFNKDIVIDLIGYRRFGHNEMDEPLATQPSLYKRIKQHPTVYQQYGDKLAQQGLIAHEELSLLRQEFLSELESKMEVIKKTRSNAVESEMDPPLYIQDRLEGIDTKVSKAVLKQINTELLQFPEQFDVFPKLKKILERRRNAVDDGGKVDWALAETLAFATIVSEGTPIRLTGQDSERGTFSQRHLVLHDYSSDKTYSPIHAIPSANASFAIYNSPLSEAACVGFEYGYNVYAPETLTIWEAQYGDFSNGAQVLFDQFISAGRAKWGQKSGLILLLPHGYEGQGPEHSSGRVERFLQLAAENNWHVANLTKSSQYFHILRRQAKSLGKNEVRPLVIMTPKSLLRNERVAADARHLSEGHFLPVMQQNGLGQQKDKVKRFVFCSGKIAVDLEEGLSTAAEPDWLQIVRIEELYPFPKKYIQELKNEYPSVAEWVWVQEEPRNMGAWHYILPHLREMADKDIAIRYIGRRRRSSTAEGDPKMHKKEQSRIVREALTREVKGRDEE